VTASCFPLLSLSESSESELCDANVERGRFPSVEVSVGFRPGLAPDFGFELREKPFIEGLGVADVMSSFDGDILWVGGGRKVKK